MAAALAVVALGCDVPPDEVVVPEPDPAVFRDDVYPILLRDCAFSGCHGDPERFFAVFGPGRTRLRAETDLDAPVTTEELAVSYARAQSMLLSPGGIQRAPLVRKPLAEAAGGVRHRGTDPWGGAIFPSKQDPRFVVLAQWALAAAP